MHEAERRPDDPEPGYYAIDAGVLNVRELVRLRGLLRLPLALMARGLTRPAGRIWMPCPLIEIGCRPEELSPRFQQLTATHRADLAALGFEVCYAARMRPEDAPENLDNGTLIYLDAARSQMAFIAFVQRKASIGAPIDEWQVLSFVARVGAEVLVAADKREGFDPPPGTRVVVARGAAAPALHRRFAAELARAPDPPQAFADKAELLAWQQAREVDAVRRGVARGLYVRLGGREIGSLRRAPEPPTSLRRRVLGWVPSLAAFGLAYWAVGRLSTPASSAQHIDEFCERLLKRGLHHEARSWLAEDRPDDTRSIGERTADESRSFVEDLYRRGAVDVQAVPLLAQPDQQVAMVLVLRLPEDRDQRRALLSLEPVPGHDGVPDEGQHFMLLHATANLR